MCIHSKLLNLLGSIAIFNRGFISGGKCSFLFSKTFIYTKKKDILEQFSCNFTFKFRHSCLLKKNDQQIWEIHRWFLRYAFIEYYCHNLVYHFIQFSFFFFFSNIISRKFFEKTLDSHGKKPMCIWEFFAKRLSNTSFIFAVVTLCSFTVIKCVCLMYCFVIMDKQAMAHTLWYDSSGSVIKYLFSKVPFSKVHLVGAQSEKIWKITFEGF